ncbi:MAG: response regulator [Planctomycetes bacterium]|nr:response regulator [Planctomycetota bacterium]
MTTGPIVLVIDDSRTIRQLLEIVLGQTGYQVQVVETGQEGIDRARAIQPRLILLDHVLPDMGSLDVCLALAQDQKTASLPLVIMTAKGNDVRASFANHPQVVDFLPKPFTPPDVVNMVKSVLQRMSSSRASSPLLAQKASAAPREELFSLEQKNRAAQACFQLLRDRLVLIPKFMKDYRDEPAAPFFAKRILVPEVLDALLATFLPLYRDIIVPDTTPGPNTVGALLEGQTGAMPLRKLVDCICGLGRSGELTLRSGARTTTCFVRKGEIVVVTHDQPEEYVRGYHNEMARVDDATWSKAAAEQRRSGKPAFVTLVEAKQLDGKLLPDLVYRQGQAALAAALAAAPGRFAWRERPSLPTWVEAVGRALHLDQSELERLRDLDDWTQVEGQVTSVDQVYHRAEDFAERVGHFTFTDAERLVLARIDGRAAVKEIGERSGVPTLEVFHILFRLSQVGLIVLDPPGGSVADRPVMILDPDVEGVMKPLAKQLRDRVRPVSLLAVAPDRDVLQSIINERPGLVLLNAASIDAAAVARGVRLNLMISNIPMAAILEQADPEQERLLREAGFDAVLAKPMHVRDIEHLLESGQR